MTLPGLPEGIDLIAYRPATATEHVWVLNGIYPGPTTAPMFVIMAAPGYEIRYNISNDTHQVVTSGPMISGQLPQGEVIQSALTGAILMGSAPEGDAAMAATATATATQMSFPPALELMKSGSKAKRSEWKDSWLEFDHRMLPHLKHMPGGVVWAHTKEDMLARDWVVV